MKGYWVIHKGGHRTFVTARSGKEAVTKVRKLYPVLEVIGYSEIV